MAKVRGSVLKVGYSSTLRVFSINSLRFESTFSLRGSFRMMYCDPGDRLADAPEYFKGGPNTTRRAATQT